MYDDVRTTQYKPSHTQYNCVIGVFLTGSTQVSGITMSCLTKNPTLKSKLYVCSFFIELIKEVFNYEKVNT